MTMFLVVMHETCHLHLGTVDLEYCSCMEMQRWDQVALPDLLSKGKRTSLVLLATSNFNQARNSGHVQTDFTPGNVSTAMPCSEWHEQWGGRKLSRHNAQTCRTSRPSCIITYACVMGS